VAILSIPDRYQLGVSKIRELDVETVRAFREALDRSVDPSIPHGESAKPAATVAAAIRNISQLDRTTDVKKIAEALISMYMAKAGYETPLDEFIDGIADSLETVSNPDLRLAPEEKDAFKEKLGILLNAEVFGIIAKADDLLTENERIFCRARILTDLRPVFGTDVDKGPVAMLITHSLKISFHESGRKGDHFFYVSLDDADLSALKDIISRAEAKANSLKGIVPDGIRLFGAPER
jgi:hypothetical protein